MIDESAEVSDPAALEPPVSPTLDRQRGWRLAIHAVLLDERAYAAVRDASHPFRRGFAAMFTVWVIVTVARLIGMGIAELTSPQLGRLQKLLHDFAVSLPWFAEQVKATPAFATQFEQGYVAGWEVLRLVLGLPSWPGTLGTIVGVALLTLMAWFVYGVLAHWLARWFGGRARFGQTLGVLALAYAPLLLLVIELVPSARVPTVLLFGALLVAKYQALKQAHDLAPGYTLATVVAPFVIVAFVLMGLILFGTAIGIEQAPALQQAVPTSLGQLFAGA